MRNKRRNNDERSKRNQRSGDDMDLDKVERLRAAVESGEFGMDFETLIERLVHAMRT